MPLNIATQWKELIPPDEAARFDRYATELRALQKNRAHGGTLARALHAKPLRFGATAAKLALFPVDSAAAPQAVGTADAFFED